MVVGLKAKADRNILAEWRGLCVIPAQAAVQAALCLLWCSAVVSGAKVTWTLLFLDSRFRGNDTLVLDSRLRGNDTLVLDSRFRGNDTVGGCSPKGGPNGPGTFWIPAFAGMTLSEAVRPKLAQTVQLLSGFPLAGE